MKCYKWRMGVVVRKNMVGTNKVHDDLLRKYLNNLFSVSILYCVVKKFLKPVLNFILNCVKVVTNEIKHCNTKYNSVDGYNMLQVAKRSGS